MTAFSVDVSPILARLRDPEVSEYLRGLPTPIFDYFFERLCDGGLDTAESAEDGTAGTAGNNTSIIRLVWNANAVTAALIATKRHQDILGVQERVSFHVGGLNAESYQDDVENKSSMATDSAKR